MRFRACLRGLTCRVLGLVLCLWGLGTLTGPGSQAQIIGPEGAPLAGPNYIVPSDLGETRGANLFHRFVEFNVQGGERVTFIGPDAIANIIALVTGDHPSHIDGNISSDIPDANLFLLNPNGIMFGANAQVSVNGSFYVSTADGVRFADDTIYTGDLGDEGSLTVASPVAFGFMHESLSPVKPIVIEGSSLSVIPGQTLSIVGGDIRIVGGSLLASGGSLNLISVGTASQGDVPLDMSEPPPDLANRFEAFGAIELSHRAGLSTRGNSGGRIVIRGGQLTVDQSSISSSNTGNIDSSGDGIDIAVTGTLQLTNGSSVISAASREGNGGDITVTANEIGIAEGASIATSGSGSGRAGNVQVRAATSVTIRDVGDGRATGIFSFAGFDSQAGVVAVMGDSLAMDGGAIGTAPNANTGQREPRSGSVIVDVGRLTLTGGAQIDSSTSSDFPGGTVTIMAGVASLTDRSVITVGTTGAGDAGDITIAVGLLTLQGGAKIASESIGSGDARTIGITADEIRLSDSTVTTNANQANGGRIEIRAGTLRVHHSAITATVNEEEGMGGNISVNANLFLLENSEIIARASEGMGGTIGIVAKGIVADAASVIDASSDEGSNGTVNIESIIDFSENAAQLPQSFAEPITLFEEPCAKRLRGVQVSSFVVSGRTGVPAEPSGGLPSLMVDIPLERWDATGALPLARRPEARLARPWRQASMSSDCQPKQLGAPASQHAQ